jgi:hypothetical protein
MDNTEALTAAQCPCCPGSPSVPCCPFPGGCAFCNAAKAPCLVCETPFAFSNVWLGHRVIEISFSYAAPVDAGLMRPPRT